MLLWIIVACLVVGLIAGVIAAIIVRAMDGPGVAQAIVGVIIGIIAVWITFMCLKPWAFVDNYELGYIYDSRDGSITVLPHTGYTARLPFFQNVHTIDLRPRQVCINVGGQSGQANGINQRVLNCKLVSFNPKGLPLFLSWHGRGDYDGDTLNDLLKIYAYDPGGRAYPFLNISDTTRSVIGPQSIGVPLPPAAAAQGSPVSNAQ